MTWLALPLLLAPYLAQDAPGWSDIDWGYKPITELRVHVQAPAWLKQAAKHAARDWCQWDKSLCLKVRLVRHGENVFVSPDIAEQGFAGLTNWWDYDHEPVILVADRSQVPVMTMEEVFSHEVGHALCGCVGHPSNGGLMDGDETVSAPETTFSDVAMVLYFRWLGERVQTAKERALRGEAVASPDR